MHPIKYPCLPRIHHGDGRRRSGADSCRTRPDNQIAGAFSIVELLTVMGMIALLLSMAVPAVSSILKGSQMTQALTEVSGLLEQARQYAIAQNTYVWVAFNDAPTATDAQLRVVVLASKSGTEIPTWGMDDATAVTSLTRLLNRVKTFKQVKWNQANTFGTAQIASLPPAIADNPGAANFTIMVPGDGAKIFDKAIEFTPSGEARTSMSMAGIVEFGLQPTRGLAPDPANVAVVRVNGLTGQSAIFRP